jgi:hypothetical protein
MISANIYIIFFDNRRYIRATKSAGGFAPPEARLPPAILGGVVLPLGLFWFAWTNSPSIHWLASVAAGVPFGFGTILLFVSVLNYLIDAYTIFAASVLAANTVLRSLFGAAFPLFTAQMYDNLGIHWASSIPAFLALMCVPFPFLFYRYGSWVRLKSPFAARADEFMKNLRARSHREQQPGEKSGSRDSDSTLPDEEMTRADEDENVEKEESPEDVNMETDSEEEAFDEPQSRFEPVRTAYSRQSSVRPQLEYNDNPYDIDRVNTRETFGQAPTTRTRSSASNAADGGGRRQWKVRSIWRQKI